MRSLQARDFSNGTEIEVFCPHCQYVLSKGRFVILVCENDKLVGLVPDSSIECCGVPLVAPKVFGNLAAANVSLHLMLNARRIEMLPISLFQ